MEYGLYSDDEFARLSENFVCVRTYVGLPEATEMLKKFGIIGTRRGPWVQGNNIDFVFFTPELKALTHEDLKPVTPEPTEDGQNSIRWVYTVIKGLSRERSAPVANAAMKKILERYPPKDRETLRIPWHLNADTAVHFASYEDRRIVVVPGDADSKLLESLGSQALLRKHIHNYAFLQLEDEVPEELREAMQQAGPDGVVIVERPQNRNRDGSLWESAEMLSASPGPHTPESLLRLLDKHARPAGWDAVLSLAR